MKVFEWFKNCWKKAGGLSTKENYVFNSHDSDKLLDLKQQKWFEN